MMSSPYTVMVAVNNSKPSFKAIKEAVDLLKGKPNYKLYITLFVGLNPATNIPYLDHLDKAHNIEIREEAHKEELSIKQHMENNYKNLNYEFLEIEGEGEVEKLIDDYIKTEFKEQLNLLVVGTRNNGPFKRWALGSISEYLVHHVKCPVMVVKID